MYRTKKDMQFDHSLKVERAPARSLYRMRAAVECGAEGGCLVEVGPVPCVDRLMERRGAQRSDDVRTQSATQRETADMQRPNRRCGYKGCSREGC